MYYSVVQIKCVCLSVSTLELHRILFESELMISSIPFIGADFTNTFRSLSGVSVPGDTAERLVEVVIIMYYLLCAISIIMTNSASQKNSLNEKSLLNLIN